MAAQPPAAEEEAAEAPAAAEQPLEPVEEAPTPKEPEVPNPNMPAKAWAQCGGTTASQNATVAWPGPSTCVENSTCVWLSSTFSQVCAAGADGKCANLCSGLTRAFCCRQCVPTKQSRGYGCSAVYAACGGADAGTTDAWSGPYCCAENTECVFFSNTYSQCKPCNGAYEQWCATPGWRMQRLHS